MKNQTFVPFARPCLDKREEKAVIRVMRSGWLTTGKEALAFETEFAAMTGSMYAIAVNSSTSGLFLSMEAAGVSQGTSIITTPYTFVSTASTARHLGAEVLYADTEEDTYNISPEAVESLLKKNDHVKAVLPVHIGGLPCTMEPIICAAHHKNALVIEDSAHAFPSETPAGYAGTLGDIGVFSFYTTKTITTGEGGMVTTNNDEIAKRIRMMRLHGFDRQAWDRYTSTKPAWQYDVIESGYKMNLPDILATIGRVQLAKAHDFLQCRKRIAERYNKAFMNFDFITLPPDGIGNAWHLYPIRLNLDKINIDRDEFATRLMAAGIGISVHFIPHFLMSYYKQRYNLKITDYPNAMNNYIRSISLPIWPGMTEKQINKVINAVITVGTAAYRTL